jgi:hypothetical protein
MANNGKSGGIPFPIQTMLAMGLAGAVLVGFSFQVIIYWPVPVAVAPYFEDSLFQTGATWGFIVGGFVGWLIGHLSDESHFIENKYE